MTEYEINFDGPDYNKMSWWQRFLFLMKNGGEKSIELAYYYNDAESAQQAANDVNERLGGQYCVIATARQYDPMF